MPGRTTGDEIFRLLDAFMTEVGLRWEKCVPVWMDGAAAMVGRKRGVIARIKAVVMVMHCMLHQQVLFMKKTELWRRSIQDGVTDMFPQLYTNNLSVAIVRVVASLLTVLSENFSSYFSNVPMSWTGCVICPSCNNKWPYLIKIF